MVGLRPQNFGAEKAAAGVVQVALIAVGLVTYVVATYLIVKIVVALNALNTVPPQPKKLPEARAVGIEHIDFAAAINFPGPAPCFGFLGPEQDGSSQPTLARYRAT